MLPKLEPVKTDSLKEACIKRLEEMIISGVLTPGRKLPPERELALQLGVSRPVVHEALVEIAARGLVSLKPRKGTVVNDYRKEGSLALLGSLLNYHHGSLDPKLLEGLLDMRVLFETENARLAACNRTRENLSELKRTVRQEITTDDTAIDLLTELDFQFHLTLALSTGNMSYPLLLNSFKPVYTNFTGKFFTMPSVVGKVHAFHADLVTAIEKRDVKGAVGVMARLLEHGEVLLKNFIARKEASHGHDPNHDRS